MNLQITSLDEFTRLFISQPLDIPDEIDTQARRFIETLPAFQLKNKTFAKYNDVRLIGLSEKQRFIMQKSLPYWMALFIVKLHELLTGKDNTNPIQQIVKNYERIDFELIANGGIK